VIPVIENRDAFDSAQRAFRLSSIEKVVVVLEPPNARLSRAAD